MQNTTIVQNGFHIAMGFNFDPNMNEGQLNWFNSIANGYKVLYSKQSKNGEWLCMVSSIIGNDEKVAEIKKEISDFFRPCKVLEVSEAWERV